MRRMISDTLQKYLKQVKETYPDPTDIGGDSYTAGTGIDITNNKISVDNTIVKTTTEQTISGNKTFTGDIKFTPSGSYKVTFDGASKFIFKGNSPVNMIAPDNQWTGLRIFASNGTTEVCNVQYSDPSKGLYIGRSSSNATSPTYAQELGFKSEVGSGSSKKGYRVLMPNKTNITGAASENPYYIPTEITDGTNTVKANSEGVVDISSLISGGGSGTTLYRHHIVIEAADMVLTTCYVVADIISSSNTTINTLSQLTTILNSGSGSDKGVLANGIIKDTTTYRNIIEIKYI